MNKTLDVATAAVAVLVALFLFPPWRLAMPSAGLDPSWIMVIAHAFERGWQFGVDVIFTYGPLGFIATPSFTPTLYLISLVYWLIFYAVTALGLCQVYRGGARGWLLVALLAVLIAGLNPIHDGRVFASGFLLFLIGRTPGRAGTALSVALTVLHAVAALMKMTYAVVSFPVVVLTDAARYMRSGTLPVLTPLYLAVFLIAYFLSGQSIGSLWPYLTAAAEISRGYNEAMIAYGPLGEVIAFGTIVALGAALMGWNDAGRSSKVLINAFLTMAAFVIAAFVTAKAGFVRHDTGHPLISWMALSLILAGCLGALSADKRKPRIRAVLMAGLVTISLLYEAMSHLAIRENPSRTTAAPVLLIKDFGEVAGGDAENIAKLAFGDHYGQMLREYPEFMKKIRTDNPLPAVSGTADIFGGDQVILLAHGIDYRPRPTFQSYSVYTPELIARNVAFLRSDRAPETVLFKVFAIDQRLPSLDDGALWPELFRYYDITDFQNGYAVLKRRMRPRDVRLDPLQESKLAFGEDIDVSQWNDGPLWVELDIHPTLIGKIRNALAKPPLLEIAVTTENGHTNRFRLIPAMAGSGFLLSPLVQQTDQFVTLDHTQIPRVVKFSIGPAKHGGLSYERQINVRLKRLAISSEAEHKDGASGGTIARLHLLRRLMISGKGPSDGAQPTLLPDNSLLAHAPTQLALDVPQDVSTLSFAYGLLPGAWSNGGMTTGACFRVSGETNGVISVLHKRCLDPAKIESERGKMLATVNLNPQRPSRLIFETLTGATADWDWTFWSDLSFQ